MSKVSFRARQIDFNKPLPIIRNDSEVHSDISENALVNRGVPVLPSGMEKEEENEHHLVEVLHALQTKKTSDVVIPVPEIEEDTNAYFSLYEKGFSPPNHFIHIRTIVLAEEEPVEYDMDSEDEVWLSKNEGMNITPDQFETMIYTLERGCGQKVINLEEAKCLLQNYDASLVIAIYDYWLTKRVQSRQPLILTVRQEKRNNETANDPYIAFRRRTERMQTRKNRKNDEYSYEKMLILREQMESLGDIIERLVKRECLKKELVDVEKKIFSTRYLSKDYEGYLVNEISSQCNKYPKDKNLSQDPASLSKSIFQKNKRNRSGIKQSKKKRIQNYSSYNTKLGVNSSGGELSDEENIFSSENESHSLASPASSAPSFSSFVRQQGCKYLRPCSRLDLKSLRTLPSSSPSSQSRLFHHHPYLSYTLHNHSNYHGYIRRRIGRGGRLIIDRVSYDSQNFDQNNQFLLSNSTRCVNDLDFLMNRVKVLTSQSLSFRQGRLLDENTPKSDSYNSISNRLRWSAHSNDWEHLPPTIAHSEFGDETIPLTQKNSNSSQPIVRESPRQMVYFDDRPSLKRTDHEYYDPPSLPVNQDSCNECPKNKNSNLGHTGNNEQDNEKSISWPQESNSGSKIRKVRPVRQNLGTKGENLQIQSIDTASSPNCNQQQSFTKHAKDSQSNWMSTNGGGNSKRCRISITSKLPNSNNHIEHIDSSQNAIAKTNGSSNYCFFVPTPNSNSQTASNV